MDTIGSRLKEERKKLDLSQGELGVIGGVKRQQQAKYERDESSPGADYLAKAHAFGLDVQYVVTGERHVSGLDTTLLNNCIAAGISVFEKKGIELSKEQLSKVITYMYELNLEKAKIVHSEEISSDIENVIQMFK